MTAEGWKGLESSLGFQRFERSPDSIRGIERLEQILGTLAHGPKRLDAGPIVALAEKNFLPILATGHYRVEQTFGMNSRVPRHLSRVSCVSRLRQV